MARCCDVHRSLNTLTVRFRNATFSVWDLCIRECVCVCVGGGGGGKMSGREGKSVLESCTSASDVRRPHVPTASLHFPPNRHLIFHGEFSSRFDSTRSGICVSSPSTGSYADALVPLPRLRRVVRIRPRPAVSGPRNLSARERTIHTQSPTTPLHPPVQSRPRCRRPLPPAPRHLDRLLRWAVSS